MVVRDHRLRVDPIIFPSVFSRRQKKRTPTKRWGFGEGRTGRLNSDEIAKLFALGRHSSTVFVVQHEDELSDAFRGQMHGGGNLA